MGAIVDAAAAAAREPLGRNSPTHGIGCSGKDELGDSPSEECVSMPLSELNTVNKREWLQIGTLNGCYVH